MSFCLIVSEFCRLHRSAYVAALQQQQLRHYSTHHRLHAPPSRSEGAGQTAITARRERERERKKKLHKKIVCRVFPNSPASQSFRHHNRPVLMTGIDVGRPAEILEALHMLLDIERVWFNQSRQTRRFWVHWYPSALDIGTHRISPL